MHELDYADANFMFPCWLLVTNVSGSTTSLKDSIASSGYRRYLADASSGVLSFSQRETTIVLPKTVVGRYVRIHRADPLSLSIAEVQVYSNRACIARCTVLQLCIARALSCLCELPYSTVSFQKYSGCLFV